MDYLKIRYRQINDWPFMGDRYKIGKIFTFETEIESGIVAAYPHLFKKMNWFDGITLDNIPKYLIINIDYKKYNINDKIETTKEVFGKPNWWGWTLNADGTIMAWDNIILEYFSPSEV